MKDSFDTVVQREKTKLVLLVALGILCYEAVVITMIRTVDPRVQFSPLFLVLLGPLMAAIGVYTALRAKAPSGVREYFYATGELPQPYRGPRGFWWWMPVATLLLTGIASVAVKRMFQ